jgi:hypothetical protein
MRRRRATDRWIGLVLAILLFVAYPAIIIASAQNCTDGKSGILCKTVMFLLDDGTETTRIAKAKPPL